MAPNENYNKRRNWKNKIKGNRVYKCFQHVQTLIIRYPVKNRFLSAWRVPNTAGKPHGCLGMSFFPLTSTHTHTHTCIGGISSEWAYQVKFRLLYFISITWNLGNRTISQDQTLQWIECPQTMTRKSFKISFAFSP